MYRINVSSNKSRLEAHVGFFRLLMKGIFDPFVPKIQQTKMLVTCQRFGDLFLFGLIWQCSSI